ncbi:MAG: right-handed parallel beta-helix repeat-containing protein [Oscillospiraceae bacterium]|nr:right-handed parallel beta-helix repeat-containing protein [Oscillospiraceae bacterium]
MKTSAKLIAVLLAVLLLSACGTAAPALQSAEAAEPAATPAPEAAAPADTPVPAELPAEPVESSTPDAENPLSLNSPLSSLNSDNASAVVTVNTVDELLDAIAPDTAISLAAGTYDLSTASSYGRSTGNPCLRWEPVYDDNRYESYELVITGADNLTLRGAGMDSVTIAAVPRYANVLHFVNCKGLTLSQLTAGHTEQPGWCAGGVFLLDDCRDVDFSFCGMFGCGTVGVQANRCRDLAVRSSRIYDCSQYAVYLDSCRNIRLADCEICENGSTEEPVFSLLAANTSDGFLIADCRIHDNTARMLLDNSYSRSTRFLSNRVESNLFFDQVFDLEQYAAEVDACSFSENRFPDGVPFAWYCETGLYACSPDGSSLSPYELKTMTWHRADPSLLEPAEPSVPLLEVPAGGEVTVFTADEFLAALGPDRTIVLDTDLLDLSAASDYGVLGGEYYFWRDWYDGPELVIQNVQNLSIRAASDDPASCTVAAVPRYANVLAFLDCSGIRISGLTAGHTQGQGACTGGVLSFESCNDIEIAFCRLYGCGILGIETSYCSNLRVSDCEIYDCSQGGVRLYLTESVSFRGCSIHGISGTAIILTDCSGILWDGAELSNGWYDLEGSTPVPVNAWW